MQALILAGGKGTRLEPLTLETPKPIVPVVNEPLLVRQIRLLKTIGIRNIILSLNYQSAAIEKILHDGSDFGVYLDYLIEPFPLGTAGAYKFAEKSQKSTTIVLNGDIITDIDLLPVLQQHQKQHAAATIVLTEVKNPAAFGLVEVGENNRVLRFLEKPDSETIQQGDLKTVNAGIYILEKEVLQHIPKNKTWSFEYNLFPDLLEKNENVRAALCTGYWLDLGTPQRYLQAHSDLLKGRSRNFQIKRGKNYHCAVNAEIDGVSVLGDGCFIESCSQIRNSVLGENVTVQEGSVITNSVIWRGTKIGSGVNITDSIIANDCFVEKNTVLPKGSVIGSKALVNN